ncbi:MAG: hypothetical protein JAZ17_02660 [Candidatus Thiodiazotropha endolucinida]|nr:hypothetical protein [Candidatus Thiodiazotropha endolucinida]MCW4227508.1 hypothetical protein [Candidatus Thiodiazotropha taylori]RLW52434.1 MAG: hypothetical protein B6D76_15655 [gamma proteobacterium symbiont of Stewartia floridana]MCG8092521.1 hypothetical protein [Candidatus Thiodiazotropha endolucinida]MCW4327642.1 hypothetical protein [Candidatus Thiodiazotropha taylori]
MMKIKVLSDSKGTIVSAVLPPEGEVENIAEGGPAISRGQCFDELEVPVIKEDQELPQLLKRLRVKRGKKSVSLKMKKQKTVRTRASKKK